MVLLDGSRDLVLAGLRDRATALLAAGTRVGALLNDEDAEYLRGAVPALRIAQLGPEQDAQAMAHRLFAGLRELEAAGATVILVRQAGDEGLGRAIRDRLTRAAGGRVIHVSKQNNAR